MSIDMNEGKKQEQIQRTYDQIRNDIQLKVEADDSYKAYSMALYLEVCSG